MSERVIVRVREVMRTEVDIVDGMATVADVLRDCSHIDGGCVIVDKRDENDEYGILLLSDIAKKVLARNRAPERVNVYEIMSKPVVAVEPGMDIRYCARLFENFGINRAPVLDEGRVVGTVGYTDIVLHGLREIL